jgi:PIN domain nuclease of toxin-antitoxin system
MKYLLDTHICLWAISKKEKLSAAAGRTIEDKDSTIFFSPVSLWEIAIKFKLGKFPEFSVSLSDFMAAMIEGGFELLR